MCFKHTNRRERERPITDFCESEVLKGIHPGWLLTKLSVFCQVGKNPFVCSRCTYERVRTRYTLETALSCIEYTHYKQNRTETVPSSTLHVRTYHQSVDRREARMESWSFCCWLIAKKLEKRVVLTTYTKASYI